MNEDKYELHGWLEKKQVFVKDKDDDAVLRALISETLISYREYLIQNLSKNLIEKATKNPEETPINDIMESINDYNALKVAISNSIGRIRTDYFK